MNVVCAWCRAEGRSALIRIAEPFADTSESHGICERHRTEFLAAADAWMKRFEVPPRASGARRAPA
jgi:hypothetical protein